MIERFLHSYKFDLRILVVLSVILAGTGPLLFASLSGIIKAEPAEYSRVAILHFSVVSYCDQDAHCLALLYLE